MLKMNWGKKLITVFVIFAAGVVSLVAISISKNTDLVSENYYEQEIKYQNQIDLLKGSEVLNENIVIEKGNNEIVIRSLNPGLTGNLKGEILFYRTSDANKDFIIDLEFGSDATQRIYSQSLDRGLWKLKMNLNEGEKKYYIEKYVFLE